MLLDDDGVEDSPVRFPGIKQGPDAVVLEVTESESYPFDAFDQIVECFGGAVTDFCLMPVPNLLEPLVEGSA